VSDLESLLVRLSAEERLRGSGFEQLTKWVLENAPEYASRLTQVWLWSERPGRGGRRDIGIDLVAQDRGGGLWAVWKQFAMVAGVGMAFFFYSLSLFRKSIAVTK
jgi:predicted helicase